VLQCDTVVCYSIDMMTKGKAVDKLFECLNPVVFEQTRYLFYRMTEHKDVCTTVSNLRISKDYPWKGSVSFTRDADGKRVKIWMTPKTYKFKSKSY
jgi:hypothetical protein